MVVIRLARSGGKQSPFYQVLVADSRKSRNGRFIERVGFYNPMARGKETRLELNQERINFWKNCGAQPTERVSLLLHTLKTDANINQAAPTKAEMKKMQMDDAHKASKAKAKAASETKTDDASESSAAE